MKKILFLILLTQACNLHDRYPKPGEFCEPMVEKPVCIFVDLKNKEIVKDSIKIQLLMTNRVQYKFIQDQNTYDLELINENRIRLRPEGKTDQEEIYIRKKEPKRPFSERWNKSMEEIKKGF